MSPAGTQHETLEVFTYTWPKSLLALGISAAIAAAAVIMLFVEASFGDWFRQLLGSWAIPLAIALGIYGLAGVAISRWLGERLKRPRPRASLVAARSGLTTQWSVQMPWNDVSGFLMGGMGTPGQPTLIRYPCAVVPNIKKYSRPSSLSMPWDLDMRWDPANAFPVLQRSEGGYLVRRNGVDPLSYIDEEALVVELTDFGARMKNAS